jgi:hypothetical protein
VSVVVAALGVALAALLGTLAKALGPLALAARTVAVAADLGAGADFRGARVGLGRAGMGFGVIFHRAGMRFGACFHGAGVGLGADFRRMGVGFGAGLDGVDTLRVGAVPAGVHAGADFVAARIGVAAHGGAGAGGVALRMGADVAHVHADVAVLPAAHFYPGSALVGVRLGHVAARLGADAGAVRAGFGGVAVRIGAGALGVDPGRTRVLAGVVVAFALGGWRRDLRGQGGGRGGQRQGEDPVGSHGDSIGRCRGTRDTAAANARVSLG